jgi:2'-5' RNA ligase
MPDEPKTRRVFFALWPDEPTRSALAHATRKAVRASGGRPVPVDNLHSTLAFLGSVRAERLSEVSAAASGLDVPPFELVFDRIEHWPKPAILCAGCSRPPPEAGALAASLWKVLARQGFVPDAKPYRPHVTLARKVVKPHGVGDIEPVAWRVDAVALVESVTAPAGSQYTVIEGWPLRR